VSVFPIPKRVVEIPPKYSVFMPLINWISFPESAQDTDIRLIAEARKKMDVIGDLQFAIDGIKISEDLSSYRVISPVFECLLPENNIFGMRPGITRAVSDGYWIFIGPMQGNTSLSTFASCSAGATKIGVCYDVRVRQRSSLTGGNNS
jgi:hypothetical protein